MRSRAAFIGTILLALTVALTGCFLFQPQVKVGFEASTVKGPQPLVVAFTPVVEETAISFAWDFGDGTTSDEADPVHVYKAAGTYSVSLTVELPGGCVATETKVDFLIVDVSLRKSSPSLVYWVNDRGVLMSGGRGGIGETVIAQRFFSLGAMQSAGNKLYWVDMSLQSILRANLDGTGQETLVHGRETNYLPVDLAVDPVGEKVYWVCLPHDTPIEDAGDYAWVWLGGIHRADLDGSNVETLITYESGWDENDYATEIAVDSVRGRVYWCLQSESSWKLQYSPTDSWAPQTVGGDLPGSPRGLALNTISEIGARYAYFITGHKVQRLRIAGGEPVDVLDGIEWPRDIAVDALEGKLYVATWDGIIRANLNGSESEVIFSDEEVEVLTLR